MATLAILDETLPLQLRERPSDLDPIRVVWSGSDRDRLFDEAPLLRPTVLALDLELLGDDGVATANALAEQCGAELVLLLYRYAPRDVLRSATDVGARPVKTPIKLDALRTQMTSVIVREILRDDVPGAAPAKTTALAKSARRSPGARPTELPTVDPSIPVRRFSRAQLARLAEIRSSIQCECPNHLSELLLALTAFEDYSRACESRNDDDARIHGLLHRNTARARAIVEDALAQLLVHEKIVL